MKLPSLLKRNEFSGTNRLLKYIRVERYDWAVVVLSIVRLFIQGFSPGEAANPVNNGGFNFCYRRQRFVCRDF
jgi:hypothetical protein